MQILVDDVAAVVQSCGEKKAIIVGHDWGGAVAWQFAMFRPEMTEKLIVLNLPRPRGLMRELAHNPEQQTNSAYAREFQREGAHTNLTGKDWHSGLMIHPLAAAISRHSRGRISRPCSIITGGITRVNPFVRTSRRWSKFSARCS